MYVTIFFKFLKMGRKKKKVYAFWECDVASNKNSQFLKAPFNSPVNKTWDINLQS